MSRNFQRTPCQDCGGPKGPGRGERYCSACRAKLHVPTIPLDDQLAIVRAYSRPRTTLAEVAASFYVSTGTVTRVLRAHDVPVRPRGGYGASRARLSVDEQLLRTQLYGQGLTLAQIGDVVGRSPSSIQQSLVKAGVRLRPQGVNRPGTRHWAQRTAGGRFAAKEAA